MLKDKIVHDYANVDATYTADTNLNTGMGVVKDLVNKLAKLPTAETGVDIVFVQKDRTPIGINAAKTQFSDYDVDFNTVNAGDKVVLYAYAYDNIFATDQYDETTVKAGAEGSYVAWGTDGKAVIAAAGTASNYKFLGLVSDAGHTLARFYKTEKIGNN